MKITSGVCLSSVSFLGELNCRICARIADSAAAALVDCGGAGEGVGAPGAVVGGGHQRSNGG